MLWDERQEKVKKYTHSSIEKIASEIGVDVPFYPNVYWVGRKLNFEDTGLNKKYRKVFDEIKQTKGGVYLPNPKMILIGGYFLEDIAEESGHFLHLHYSQIKKFNLENMNDFCRQSIIEMFGFFCSKIIKPERKNDLKKKSTFLFCNEEKNVLLKKINYLFKDNNKECPLFWVYQNGYSLGENLFNYYKSGKIPIENIRNLFTNPLKKRNEAFYTFCGLTSNMEKFFKN